MVRMLAGFGLSSLVWEKRVKYFYKASLDWVQLPILQPLCHRNGVSQASVACRHSPKHFIFAFTVDSTVTLEAAGGALDWGLGALGKYLLWFQLWGIGPRASGWVISRIRKTKYFQMKSGHIYCTREKKSLGVLHNSHPAQWRNPADENPHKTQTADRHERTGRNGEFLRGPGFTWKHPDLWQRRSRNRFPQTLSGCS